MAKQKRIFENEYTAIKKCKHGYFAYNTNDLFIGKSLDIYGEWCEDEMELIKPFINKGDIVLDVGANIGTHTVFFANNVGSKGFVYSFEPQRTIYHLLCTNIALNNIINVKCFNTALSDEDEVLQIPVLDPGSPQNFGGLGHKNFGHGEYVKANTIDCLELAKCDFIKIDTEGMEQNILLGAENTISKYSPTLFVENNRAEGSKETIEILFDFDYKCYWHISNYYNPKNYFNNKQNIFKEYPPESNMLCIPKDSSIKIKKLIKVKDENDTWEKAFLR